MGESIASDRELMEIFERTYGPAKENHRRPYARSYGAQAYGDAEPAGARTAEGGSSGRTGSGKKQQEKQQEKQQVLLVDGYNIIFAWKDLKELADKSLDGARSKLTDILANYRGYRGMDLILVFDAYKVAGGQERCFLDHGIHVVYTKEAETADAYIERHGTQQQLHDLPVDAWFVFTTQEEVGCRGAATAASRIKPGFGIVLEGTTAADMAGTAKGKEVCFLGRGVVIPFMDKGTIYAPETWKFVTDTAEKNGIPWQTKGMIAGGTDASAIQRRGPGARVITMSAPLRNIHSPASIGLISDLELMPRMCLCLLEELAHGS